MGGTDWEKPSPRQSRLKWPTVALVVAAVVAVGLGARGGSAEPPGSLAVEPDQSSTPSPSPSRRPSPSARPSARPTPTPSESVLPGEWAAFPPSPLGAVFEVGVASTGDQLLLWGGARTPYAQRRLFSADGASFDIDRSGEQLGDRRFDGAWRPFPPAPLKGRTGHAIAWTGAELIVWGGQGQAEIFADGAAYDPRVERWRALAPSPMSPRTGAGAVWTGTELLVLGGWDHGGPLDDAAAYHPLTNTWRLLAPAPPGLTGALEVQGLWDGESAVVWAPYPSPNGTGLARYDPVQDRWTSLPTPPGRSSEPLTAVAWSGTELYAVRAAPGGLGLWSLAKDELIWQERPSPLPDQSYPFFATWTGSRLVVLTSEALSMRAQFFDPRRRTWSATVPTTRGAFGPPYPSASTAEELFVLAGGPGVGVAYRVPAIPPRTHGSCPPWSCLPSAVPQPSRIGTSLTAASTAAPSLEHRTLPI